MRAGRVVVGAVVGCLALASAPVASAAGDLMSGSFVVKGPNEIIDTWTISNLCNVIETGCLANVTSPLITGQAVYQGAHTWMMRVVGQVPVCPDRSKTKGAMVFTWNTQTLTGSVTEIQQGNCVMTRPGQSIVPITLVAA
ncbi:hypothetical protein H7J51_20130 [Mycobacterium crocinum]|uniref:Secreted protein n=1 Tax=Mycolicibacterium crocinum TaxID=388459 RepID=A0ABY3TLY1_9MYCO|nr:hypothetical protein [Mycolicibacterium crocinum]MCV7217588.1 hypothetical protein [Mycolicibacterium crocinum]ULN42465.1 hypothetical protein MI149_04915 [Mycolicibacterium crocinum]